MSLPDWARSMLADPLDFDQTWGRSCRHCGSTHAPPGRYEIIEHYIDCPWVAHLADIFDDPPEIHIFEPKLHEPCPECGWRYDNDEDWRGREKPEPVGDYNVHVAHLAAAKGMTVEEYKNRPFTFADFLPPISFNRGGIVFPAAPDITKEPWHDHPRHHLP